ncbi:MAG: DUF1573 domain-containing protein [Bacteroidetes bacterium]|nr:MAG: DUF1573 domain-containing protein [Bacteroidota bacterium]
MKKIILLLFISTLVFAQTSYKINTESYDFGELTEGDAASHEFMITNTGKEPLLISTVRPSCGCTTPDWTKEPIMPGKSGMIKASYGTQGRAGSFNKSVTVSTNGEPSTTTLYIRGLVNPKTETNFTENEIKLSPKLIIEKVSHNFGKVEKGAKLLVKLDVKNLGRSDLVVSNITNSCNCVTFTKKQEFIKSGETGQIEIVYAPNSMNEVTDYIYLKSNDILKPSQKFTLQANVVETLNPTLLREGNTGGSMFK